MSWKVHNTSTMCDLCIGFPFSTPYALLLDFLHCMLLAYFRYITATLLLELMIQRFSIRLVDALYLSISDGLCFPEISMRQQHISALTAYKMNREMIRMVTTTPTTTAIAISISGDKCSAKKNQNLKMSLHFFAKRHFMKKSLPRITKCMACLSVPWALDNLNS